MSEHTVVEFPDHKQPDLLVGPFHVYRVQVEGRIIPRLTGYPEKQNGVDGIMLVVDGRLGTWVEKSRAHDIAWLVANALAVGAGYSHLGAESKERQFAPFAGKIDIGIG